MTTAPSIWAQTASGKAVDLLDPDPASIDFAIDVPDQLARLARFAGAAHAGPYSVAQHSVHGADGIKRETGRDDAAFAFLLHDAKEYVLTETTSPVKMLFIELARRNFPEKVASAMRDVFDLAEATIDRAVHRAAGCPWPLPEDVARLVKTMDLRMLLTERNHLLRRAPYRWAPEVERQDPVRFSFGAIRPWAWPKAADEWRQRFELYRPKASPRHPAPRAGLPANL